MKDFFEPKNILVTGGAGFIGSNFIRFLLAANKGVKVVNLDLLTYAGSLHNLENLPGLERYEFIKGNICDKKLLSKILKKHSIDTVVHFAAESHVDRSILGPADFIETNLVGTFTLLEAARTFWSESDKLDFKTTRFHHVSTDEVYGSLKPDDPAFNEGTPYAPNSPYSASKAGSDHLVRAYYHTYGLPIVTTNCSNNYGPFQFPEKLIPLIIFNALNLKNLPVYGDGAQVRDWLYVEDHCDGIYTALQKGRLGETYNIGGNSEMKNLDVVKIICGILDEVKARGDKKSYGDLITFVEDRPGHDRRYAMDISKINEELKWQPKETFETGLKKTIEWYLNHEKWIQKIMAGGYKAWIQKNYGERNMK